MRRVPTLLGLATLATVLAFAMVPTARAASGFQLTVAGPMTISMDVTPLACLPGGSLTGSGDGVFHINVNSAGDGWFTNTFTGTFNLVPSDGTVTFSGSLTAWFGGNANLKNFAGTFIIEVNAVGSDGSTLTAHILMSMTFSPSGTMTASPVNIVCGT